MYTRNVVKYKCLTEKGTNSWQLITQSCKYIAQHTTVQYRKTATNIS